MKREDLIIIILALLLLAGMLFTLFFGGEESKHGVGGLHDTLQVTEDESNYYSLHNVSRTDPTP